MRPGPYQRPPLARRHPLATNGTGTGDDDDTVIIDRLEHLTIGDAATHHTGSSSGGSSSATIKSRSSSRRPSSTAAEAADKARRRRLRTLQQRQRLRPPSIDAIAEELQSLTPYRERPAASELVARFLLPRLAGQALPAVARFIHDADVYAAAPSPLTAAHAPGPRWRGPGLAGAAGRPIWYFFSPVHYRMCKSTNKWVPCRRVGGNAGTWRLCGARQKLDEDQGGTVNSYVCSLVYCEYTPDGSRQTEWSMREYGIDDGVRRQELVLYELFATRRTTQDGD